MFELANTQSKSGRQPAGRDRQTCIKFLYVSKNTSDKNPTIGQRSTGTQAFSDIINDIQKISP